MWSLLKRHKELLVVGALIVYPFVTFLTTGHKGRELNAFDRGVLSLTSPLERAILWACDGVKAGTSGYLALRGSHARAEELLVENGKLRAKLSALQEAALENERLKKLLAYAEASPEQEIAARILGVNPVSTFLSVRINRGEDDGVHPGMPVVTVDGVVGRVQRASGSYADVGLITDQGSKLGVLVQRSRVRATASGAGGSRSLSLENVLRTEDLEEGDLIITSGTDGVFPKGLVVGRVTAVQRNNSGMFLAAGILPAVDSTKLEEVLVVPVVMGAQAPSAQALGKDRPR